MEFRSTVQERSTFDDSSAARRRNAAARSLGFHYEVERLFLTDSEGKPQQRVEQTVLVDAESAKDAALAFIRNEGARLLGTVCDVPGDLCTATAWLGGRLYVITVWRLGSRRTTAPTCDPN